MFQTHCFNALFNSSPPSSLNRPIESILTVSRQTFYPALLSWLRQLKVPVTAVKWTNLLLHHDMRRLTHDLALTQASKILYTSSINHKEPYHLQNSNLSLLRKKFQYSRHSYHGSPRHLFCHLSTLLPSGVVIHQQWPKVVQLSIELNNLENKYSSKKLIQPTVHSCVKIGIRRIRG